MTRAAHPDEALFRGEKPFPVLPVCEHFAGSQKTIARALELQAELGPVFDMLEEPGSAWITNQLAG